MMRTAWKIEMAAFRAQDDDEKYMRMKTYPPFFGDLALGLQLGSGLSSLQDAMVLFGVDIQRFLF